MIKQPQLVNWFRVGDKVALIYDDYDVLFVRNRDFNRAFGCIVSAPKTDVLRDFVVDSAQTNSISRCPETVDIEDV